MKIKLFLAKIGLLSQITCLLPSFSAAPATKCLKENALQTHNFHCSFELSQQNMLCIQNPTPEQPLAVTLNLNGHSLIFPKTNLPVLKIAANTTLNLMQTELVNYSQNCIECGDENANIKFGDGVTIKLSKTETLQDSNHPWNIAGNICVSGAGTTLALEGNQCVIIQDNATLTLENLRLVIKKSDALAMLGDNSRIVFNNCDLVLYNAIEWSINKGNIDVSNKLHIFGGSCDCCDSFSTLTFATTGIFKVHQYSTLHLNRNVCFKYQANPANDNGSVFASKRHFLLQDATATLEMDGSTLHSTQTGFALDCGRVVISDSSTWQIDGTDGSQAELGSDVDFYIKPSVSFNFTGSLEYNDTEIHSSTPFTSNGNK